MKHLNYSLIIGLTTLLLFTSLKPTYAQKGKNTIYVGYGTQTHNDLSNLFEDIALTLGSAGLYKSANDQSPGVFYAGYRTFVTSNIEVGGVVLFQPSTYDYVAQSGNQTVYAGKSSAYSVLVDAKYNYLNKSRLKLYSGIGAGIGVIKQKVKSLDFTKSDTKFAFQVDAIGVSYGEKVAPFINLGYGYKGIINAGVQMKF